MRKLYQNGSAWVVVDSVFLWGYIAYCLACGLMLWREGAFVMVKGKRGL